MINNKQTGKFLEPSAPDQAVESDYYKNADLTTKSRDRLAKALSPISDDVSAADLAKSGESVLSASTPRAELAAQVSEGRSLSDYEARQMWVSVWVAAHNTITKSPIGILVGVKDGVKLGSIEICSLDADIDYNGYGRAGSAVLACPVPGYIVKQNFQNVTIYNDEIKRAKELFVAAKAAHKV